MTNSHRQMIYSITLYVSWINKSEVLGELEVAKKIQLEEHIKKEQQKLKRIRDYPREYDDGIREDIMKQIDALNDELVTRQESIDLL